MTKRKKILIVISTIVLIIAAIGASIYFIFFHNSNTEMKLRALGNLEQHEASQFQNSRINLYKNGTFAVVVVQGEDFHMFTGIGTYTKSDGKVHFTYTDAWIRENDVFLRDNSSQYIGERHSYSMSKRGQIEFILDQDKLFYFR